ncbi:hypothetical protein DNK57_01965 [Methanothermobacter thermautotrophicus]|uniref:Uncharacterized protein n=1 Tax=Methanothermobacter thermautotrophicus TaxID=145262 RepID=A0A842YJR6_METTF|nr:hypothetical protein [Methanothermobacter thermautotrophicus]
MTTPYNILKNLQRTPSNITIDYPGEAKKTIMGLPFGGAPVKPQLHTSNLLTGHTTEPMMIQNLEE